MLKVVEIIVKVRSLFHGIYKFHKDFPMFTSHITSCAFVSFNVDVSPCYIVFDIFSENYWIKRPLF